MIVTVNGKTWKLNVGCRSFISAVEIFEYFGVAPCDSLKFILNGKPINKDEYTQTMVSNHSKLRFDGVQLHPNIKRSFMVKSRTVNSSL